MPAIALTAGVLGLTGCGSDDKKAPAGNIFLEDENNYSSQSSIDVPMVETAEADLDICWTDVDQDLQCHTVAPETDVNNVGLTRFLHLSEAEVEAKLTAGELASSETDGYVDYQPGGASTCMKLSQMTLFGTPIKLAEEYTIADDRVYMLLFAKGTTPGVGARTMTFLKPTATSTNTTVAARPGCGMLEFSADLVSATPLSMPATGPWVIDWRNMTKDSLGNPIIFGNIDGIMVGFFDGMTVAELEAKIMDLELLATDMWELPLKGGRTGDLGAALHKETGARFKGFQNGKTGVWALGLMCSTCQNPAPIVLTILDPEGA